MNSESARKFKKNEIVQLISDAKKITAFIDIIPQVPWFLLQLLVSVLFVVIYFSESMNIFLVALTCLGVCQFALVNLNTKVMIEGGKFKNEKNSKINEAL